MLKSLFSGLFAGVRSILSINLGLYCFFTLTAGIALADSKRDLPVSVVVSIPPLAKIVGDILGQQPVPSLLPKGQNPVSYDPKISQVSALAKADLFFSVGVPFEKKLLASFRQLNTKLVVIPLREGMGLSPIEAEIHKDEGHHHHHHGDDDPHVWLDPVKLEKIVTLVEGAVLEFLKKKNPKHLNLWEDKIERNAMQQRLALSELYQSLLKRFKPFASKSFMVFHPAYGHFASRFGLEQIAIEENGREPGPKRIKELLEIARKKKINRIFVQDAFPSKGANWLAKSLQVEQTRIDPMSPDPIASIRKFGDYLVKDFQTIYSIK